jgi:hypothetical protein
MFTLTADDVVLATLRQATGPAEIRDLKGNLVGFFAPANSGGVRLNGPATEADLPEIERRKATETGGKTTREVFERLKSLTADQALQAYLQQKIEKFAEEERCGSP